MAIAATRQILDSLRRLTRERLFWVGLAIRVFLIAFATPAIAVKWFVPFMTNSVRSLPTDPWTAHLAAHGDALAFPYGPVMWAFLAPGVAVGQMLASWTGIGSWTRVGLEAGVFGADLGLLLLLVQLAHGEYRKMLAFYWLSPVVIYICYWHGQLDVVPVVFLTASLWQLRERRITSAGILAGLAVAAKLSMVLAIPFLFLFFLGEKRTRHLFPSFAWAAAGTAAAVQGIALLAAATRQMVLGNPELQKVYDVSFALGDSRSIFVLPVVYAMVVYIAWRVRRISFDLLVALLGLAFFSVLLLTPASPGWYMWVIPFLSLYQSSKPRKAVVLVSAFSLVYLTQSLFRAPGASLHIGAMRMTGTTLIGALSAHSESLLLSTFFALGCVLAFGIVREGILRNDYFRLRRKPLLIGIGGDSGAGKDTLAESLTKVFGKHSVAHLSGDDYHLWDRSRPAWKMMTHLNPRANDLYKFTNDFLSISQRKSVTCLHYDHESGKLLKPRVVKANDVVIISGLHALYGRPVTDRLDVRIFLDMDPRLRFAFKVRRDAKFRGYSVEQVTGALEARRADVERFIKPQAAAADLVFSLEPAGAGSLSIADSIESTPRLRLRVLMRKEHYQESLIRVLLGVCGLNVDVTLPEGSAVELLIDGDVDSDDIAFAADRLVPQLQELVDLHPVWDSGMTGLMQLISVAHSAHALRNRIS